MCLFNIEISQSGPVLTSLMGKRPHSTGKVPGMMTRSTAALTDTVSGMCTLKSLSHSFYYEQSIFACFHLRSEGLLTGEALQKITPRRWFTQFAAELPYVQTSSSSNLCNIYDLAVRIFVMGSSHVRDVLWDWHRMAKECEGRSTMKGAAYLQLKHQVLLTLPAIPIFSWIIIQACSYSNC